MMNFFKSKTGKTIAIILVVAIVLYIAFKPEIDIFAYRAKKKVMGGNDDNSGGSNTNEGLDGDKLLKMGVTGAEVRELQEVMKLEDPSVLPKYGVDGAFGAETEAALIKLRNRKETTLNDFQAPFAPNGLVE